MNYSQRLVYNKLISGAFRVGVSQQLVVRALSQLSEIPVDIITHRAMGDWEPTPEFFDSLLKPDLDEDETPIARPFPFHLGTSDRRRPARARRHFGLARPSGNGMASVLRSSNARAKFLCGRAAKISSPIASPRSQTPLPNFPMGRFSMAKCCRGSMAAYFRSQNCSVASDEKSVGEDLVGSAGHPAGLRSARIRGELTFASSIFELVARCWKD
jgi:hypothetical protein